MSKFTISTLKFVGTISLGLLTGVSYTITNLTLPTLLALPSASTAHATYLRLQTLAKRHLRALSFLALSSLSLSFIISPKAGRHPYLLWTSATALLCGCLDFVLRPDEGRLRRLSGSDENGTSNSEKSSASDGNVSDEEANMGFERVGRETPPDGGVGQSQVLDSTAGMDVNGEEVRNALEGLWIVEMVRGMVSGVGFGMAVVGIWGDAF